MDDGDSRQAWTRRMAYYNTLGTILGAIMGIVAIMIALVALLDG